MKIVNLGEVARIYNGNSINEKVKANEFAQVQSGTPYIATKDVSYSFDVNYENGIKIPDGKSGKFKIARKGSVLLCAEGGSAGRKLAIIDRDVFFGNKLFCFETLEELDSRFLFYYLQGPRFQSLFRDSITGIIGGVSLEKVRNLPIEIPKLEVQRQIVEKLDSAFDDIDFLMGNRGLVDEKAKELQQSLLSLSFAPASSELDNSQPCQDFTVEMVKLSDICSFSRGLTYSKSDEVDYSSNVVLRANNIDLASNSLNLDELRYIKESIKIKKEKVVKKNSLIICTASGSKSHVGKVALIDSDYGYAFGGFMGLLTPSDNCHPKFLFYVLTSRQFKDFLMNLSDGSNINNLKFSDIENYAVLLPSIKKQSEIVEKLDSANAEIESLRVRNKFGKELIAALRQSLLSSAFAKIKEVV